MDRQKEMLEKALLLRNFEITLFWTRFNYFWLISAAALVGYVSVKDRTDGVLLLVSCFGLVSSLCWTLLNVGSKWWHEAWEAKLKRYEDILEEGFFGDHEVEAKWIFLLPLRRFSVTTVAVGISCFSAVLWFGLATWHMLKLSTFSSTPHWMIDIRFAVAYFASLTFCFLITWRAYR